MFRPEEDNEKIGKYLKYIIENNFESQRAFCRSYLRLKHADDPTPEELTNMANRLSQIINGKKAIQFHDLPYFTKLLGISCEHILSAGEYCVPVSTRVTNYSIACSKNPEEWEKFINRPDKLILNCDEYRKTVLDYALELGNYALLKYLLDNEYIWFDSREDQDYIPTQSFGAGTSIEPRKFSPVDYSLVGQLKTEDMLRTNLIALAVDNNDIEMLDHLRARENPQIYFRVHYVFGESPDFESCYNERMVRHVAASNEEILDYFTGTFEINDGLRYKDCSTDTHTFMFPYISKLLDLLISTNSPFAETALKKAIKHNKTTYQRICEQILKVKNDEEFSEERYIERGLKKCWRKDLWLGCCKDDLRFYENGDIMMFHGFYSSNIINKPLRKVYTNVARVTKNPVSPRLRQLAEELNKTYLAVKNIGEHLEEI